MSLSNLRHELLDSRHLILQPVFIARLEKLLKQISIRDLRDDLLYFDWLLLSLGLRLQRLNSFDKISIAIFLSLGCLAQFGDFLI